MQDPVAVRLPASKFGKVVEREYAEVMELEVIDGEPTYAHGRLRGLFRLDGRPVKPETDLSPASQKSSRKSAEETDGGVAAGEKEKNR